MKDLVIKISKIFDRERIGFIVIGALARDIYFEAKSLKLDLRTKDIDFAILVKDWEEFNQIKKLLKNEMRMLEDTEKIYRLICGEIPIDLLPFGGIAEPGATVRWPGQFRARMKVQGFQEAFNNAEEIILEGIKVKVIIPEMLVALNFLAGVTQKREQKMQWMLSLFLSTLKNFALTLRTIFIMMKI